MKADILTLKTIFSKDIQYVIPTFQRPYVWTQDEQREPLWIDLRNTAEWYLEALAEVGENDLALAEERSRSHFLGAVVLQQQPTPTAALEVRHVIDGQQRLTTLQVLLDAAQEVFEHDGFDTEARVLRRLVQNSEDAAELAEDRLKVWPTLVDQAAFVAAMDNHRSTSGFEESPIVQAHEFFKLQLREWLAEDANQAPIRAHAVMTALLGLFQVVVIDLATADDANVIFETLNARGTPLLASELIKNSLLHLSQQQGHVSDALYRTYWMPFDQEWWREDVRQGRLVRPRIDVFLHYWLTMETASEVPSSEVFSVFRKRYIDHDEPVETLMGEITAAGQSFRDLELRSDFSREGTFLCRWHVMDAGTSTPAVLWLFRHRRDVGEDSFYRALDAIESYLVRRMVCRMTTKNYNRLFLELLEEVKSQHPSLAGEVVESFLARQTADATLWPSDASLNAAFVNFPLYQLLTRGRLRMILETLEDKLRSPKSEEEHVARSSLTIEHVMPQAWQTNWPLPVEHTDDDIEARERALHSIGNLTLVNGRLNPSLSNGAWPDKRSGLSDHSVLHLNKDILARSSDAWDEAIIALRSRRLSALASRVWRGPAQRV